MLTNELGLCIRINGTLSPVSQGEKQTDAGANTSCSIFDIQEKRDNQKNFYHLLIDCGNGVLESIRKGLTELEPTDRILPDAMLITHAHRDHIEDLPLLLSELEKKDQGTDFRIYCTKESIELITNQFPSLSQKSSVFSPIEPGKAFQVGPFAIEPISAKHSDLPGAIIYILSLRNRKIVIGWDFESLPGTDQAAFWNPDLLILGAETYNDHKFSTGMISVSEAYNIIRRWNAKNCFIVHYSGNNDTEDAKNQWFRGPTKPLSKDELQVMIDDHLRVTGDSGKFNVKIAVEGMIWTEARAEAEEANRRQVVGDSGAAIGDRMEIEGLEKYVIIVERKEEGGKLEVTIEDSINRIVTEFTEPYTFKDSDEIRLEAKPIKSLMMKGPELRMSLKGNDNDSDLSVNISKGKKAIFSDDIRISSSDARRFARYIAENFATSS
ncbi:MAG TPA: MBL fold metallo-hydrolase [Nitrososphaera sp.]|jgi:ribonuclease BN (tRNA processing enzyme)